MSTAAWDGRTLAVDTRCTSGGLPYRVNKCCRLLSGSLFAGSGSMAAYEAMRLWLDNSRTGARPDNLKDFTGLMIDLDSRIWLIDENSYQYEVFAPFIAIGSGRDFAIAAMALGKSALEAVQLACQFDIYTGAPITELTLTQAQSP